MLVEEHHFIYSASEVTTLWRFTNVYIIIIIIIILPGKTPGGSKIREVGLNYKIVCMHYSVVFSI